MCTRYRGSEEIALDDVTGWKTLETSLLALVAMVEGCGKALSAQGHIDDAFLHLTVTRAAAHQNRYVREGGMRMCASLAEHCPSLLSSPESVSLLAQAVATGLRDAWPQVGSLHSSFLIGSILADELCVLPMACILVNADPISTATLNLKQES
jgi:hypothetical protein